MNAPSKRSGALGDAPARQKLLRLAESNSRSRSAQHVCAHKSTVAVREPPGEIHFARQICAVCGHHLRWLPRPETIERQRLNAFRLAKLAMRPGLSRWERSFVHHVSQQRKLSPRQQVLVARLCTQYLEGAP
jgi:hypothetical protein